MQALNCRDDSHDFWRIWLNNLAVAIEQVAVMKIRWWPECRRSTPPARSIPAMVRRGAKQNPSSSQLSWHLTAFVGWSLTATLRVGQADHLCFSSAD